MSDSANKAIESIRGLRKEDFFRGELPTDAIAAVESLTEAFADSDPAGRQKLMQRLERPFIWVFGRYAYYTAVESVRKNDPPLLRRGLVALAIENGGQDWRDTFPLLALMRNSARRLHVNIAELFNGVAEIASPPLQGMIASSSDCNSEQRSIESYHYKESGAGQSFRYVYEEPPSRIPSRAEWSLRQLFRQLRRRFARLY
jgi:hypothetical protein